LDPRVEDGVYHVREARGGRIWESHRFTTVPERVFPRRMTLAFVSADTPLTLDTDGGSVTMATPSAPAGRVELLAAVPMLSALTRDQLAKLVESGEDRTFHAGETIVRQGEKGLGLYVVLNGTAEVRRYGQKVTSLSAGQFFGEAALLVDEPRTADVFATTEVNCFVLNRWDFWGAVGIDPEVDRALYKETVQRLRSFQSELIE
jgi:CRP/FNR family transcriptional regulator, cyclic AMP receptor protein